jgi:nucleotide-binding universal stress UspA family protein
MQPLRMRVEQRGEPVGHGLPSFLGKGANPFTPPVVRLQSEEKKVDVSSASWGGLNPSRGPSAAPSARSHRNAHIAPATRTLGRCAAAGSLLRILVALDGSACSEEILEPSLRLAKLLDAAVTLLHVVTPPGHAASRTDQRADGSIAHLRADSDAYLRSATERFASPRTNVAIRTAIADRAAPCIAEIATTLRCDMIALATHGRGGVSRLLLGSTADQLLGMTWTPVLALRRLVSVTPAGVAAVRTTTAAIQAMVGELSGLVGEA